MAVFIISNMTVFTFLLFAVSCNRFCMYVEMKLLFNYSIIILLYINLGEDVFFTY